jgi:hypothetical protein
MKSHERFCHCVAELLFFLPFFECDRMLELQRQVARLQETVKEKTSLIEQQRLVIDELHRQ